ncbi:MAG: hypothetical protein QGF67_15765 [Lentisphaeria bacterium]|jgi:hypothetical protein|nr:hypothetical protein [Lentisphaeria bacterium]MDP7742897.1 hypothetical protein [Lentisphaeria bacterium]
MRLLPDTTDVTGVRARVGPGAGNGVTASGESRIFCCALFFLIFLVPVQALEPPAKSYRFIWLVPKDVTAEEHTVKQINRSVEIVQRWFLKQTGETFRINPVEVVMGDENRDWYTNTGKDGKWNTIHNAIKEVFRKNGTFWGDKQHEYRYVVYISADGPGGANGVPRFVGLPQEDVDGVTSKQWDTRWAGGLAHEIGHTLRLGHEGDDENDVMRMGYLNLKTTYLSKQNITKMLEATTNKGWLISRVRKGSSTEWPSPGSKKDSL